MGTSNLLYIFYADEQVKAYGRRGWSGWPVCHRPRWGRKKMQQKALVRWNVCCYKYMGTSKLLYIFYADE